MAQVRLAQNLALPLETVTQTIGILARRRAGKSYLARLRSLELIEGRSELRANAELFE